MRLIATLAAVTLVAAAATAQDTLTIVHVNDLDRMEGDGDAGGVARLATVIADVRAQGGTVVATSAGDSISPSLLSSFDEGAHMITLLNMVGLDAMALGNHEFDFGPDVTRARIAEADFTVLSNNALEPDGTLVDGVTENMMIEEGDNMVGIFGLTTRVNRSAVDNVRIHRLAGAQHAPHHVSRERGRHGGRIVGNLIRHGARDIHQFGLRMHGVDQASFQRLFSREDAPRIAPFQRLLNTDQARQEPA